MNGGQPVQVGLGARDVLGALEHLQEVVVEEEHPHVPVGDQVQLAAPSQSGWVYAQSSA